MLTDIERQSSTCKKIEAHLLELLGKLQRENEKLSNGIEETASLRGRIKLIRQLQTALSKTVEQEG
ncbi:hypothetical protein CCP3SC15_2130003 [Gammaproteobacteria bacterium]